MKKFRKAIVSVALSLAMVVGMTPFSAGAVGVTEVKFEEQDPSDGNFKFIIKSDTELGTVEIPEREGENVNELLLLNEESDDPFVVKADSITIRKNQRLSIMSGAQLECNNITAETGAVIFVTDAFNLPASLEFWRIDEDENGKPVMNMITGENLGRWCTFEYTSEGKWVLADEGEAYIKRGLMKLYFSGCGNVEKNIEIAYSLNNSGEDETQGTWNLLDMDSVKWETEEEFERTIMTLDFSDKIGEADTSIGIRVNGINKKFFNVENGWGNFLWDDAWLDEDGIIVEPGYAKRSCVENIEGQDEKIGQIWKTFKEKDRQQITVWLASYDASEKFISFGTEWINQGEIETAEMIENGLYAYKFGSTDMSEGDMKDALAAEMIVKYFWEEGGIIGGTFDIRDLFTMKERIELGETGTQPAKNAAGETVNIKYWNYVMNLGVDYFGEPIKAEGKVYELPTPKDILVFTGKEFFVRTCGQDEVTVDPFSDEIALCVCADYDEKALKINGNGLQNTTVNIGAEGGSNYCINIANDRFTNMIQKYINLITTGFEMTGKLRILKPDRTYVAVASSGETKEVYGISGEQVDTVCETTDKGEVRTQTFIGNDTIYIHPVSEELGIENTDIEDAKLADEKMAAGVKISKNADGEYEVKFLSNFYNEVPISVVYEKDGQKTEKIITIERIGLAIQSTWLNDPAVDNPEADRSNCEDTPIFHGNVHSDTSVKYDYRTQHVLVYGTYYHPTNAANDSKDVELFLTYPDGTTKTVKKLSYTPATADSVAMTDFVIEFVTTREWDDLGNCLGPDIDGAKAKAFNAIVVNKGFDSTSSFGGAQIGAGKGIYFDGDISWIFD